MTKVKFTYPWNPGAVIDVLGDDYTPLVMVVYRALCDHMWLSDEAFHVKSPAREVRISLGLSSDEFKDCVLTLINKGLIVRHYNERRELVWVSPHLRVAFEDNSMRSVNNRQHTDTGSHQYGSKPPARKRSLANSQVTDRGATPTFQYVSQEDRQPVGFMNWIPTSQFEMTGQALLLTDDNINALILKHPEKDVVRLLAEIFSKLMSSPDLRPSPNDITDQIDYWLSKSSNHLPTDMRLHAGSPASPHITPMDAFASPGL